MEDNGEDRKMMATEAIGKVFGVIMVVLYFIIGTTFIFYTPERLPEQYAKPLGILFFAYGFFRAYKYYQKYLSR